MKNLILITVVLFSQMILSQTKDDEEKYPAGRLVSLIDLTINPEKYYDEKITVQGYLFLGKECEGLFFNENDPVHGIFTNGIGVYGLGILDRKYVIISGTFKKRVLLNNNTVSSSIYRGYLTDITFAEELDKWYNKKQ